MEAKQVPAIFVLTPRALAQLRRVLAQQPGQAWCLEVQAKPTGCKQMEYALGLVQTPAADQLHWQQEGIRLCTGLSSARYLLGASLDFLEGEAEEGFKFFGPFIDVGCSCEAPKTGQCE